MIIPGDTVLQFSRMAQKEIYRHQLGEFSFDPRSDVVNGFIVTFNSRVKTEAKHAQIFSCHAVDQIYHLASPASPPNYMYNPIKVRAASLNL